MFARGRPGGRHRDHHPADHPRLPARHDPRHPAWTGDGPLVARAHVLHAALDHDLCHSENRDPAADDHRLRCGRNVQAGHGRALDLLRGGAEYHGRGDGTGPDLHRCRPQPRGVAAPTVPHRGASGIPPRDLHRDEAGDGVRPRRRDRHRIRQREGRPRVRDLEQLPDAAHPANVRRPRPHRHPRLGVHGGALDRRRLAPALEAVGPAAGIALHLVPGGPPTLVHDLDRAGSRGDRPGVCRRRGALGPVRADAGRLDPDPRRLQFHQ